MNIKKIQKKFTFFLEGSKNDEILENVFLDFDFVLFTNSDGYDGSVHDDHAHNNAHAGECDSDQIPLLTSS